MTTAIEVENSMLDFLVGDGQIMFDGNPLHIVWLDQKNKGRATSKLPRIEVDRTADNTRTLGLAPSAILTSTLVLTIVTKRGDYNKDRNEILASIYGRFPVQLNIGDATITRFPDARPSFPDKSELRTPIFIEYDAIIQN